MAELQDKITALAAFKEVSPEDIKFQGDDTESPSYWDEYSVDGEDYLVMTEDEADEALKEDIENFIDDLGIDGFSPEFQDWIKENAIDQDWFEEACEESERYYAEDIQYEEGRLVEECIEAGIISEADLDEAGEYTGDLDLVDEYSQYLVKRIRDDYDGDFVKWYQDEFGSLKEVQDRIALDIDAIVEEVKSWDGYGNNLARYDGRENEQNGFYIFRVN